MLCSAINNLAHVNIEIDVKEVGYTDRSMAVTIQAMISEEFRVVFELHSKYGQRSESWRVLRNAS
jgi:hypothetical protein